jgi:UDP-glucose 4-epimerase
MDQANQRIRNRSHAVLIEDRAGDPAVLVAASDKIQAELGWKLERDLPTMVADAWKFLQS